MYYPKNQIETGLYSRNDLQIKSTLEYYTGVYFKTSDGKFFSGPEPNVGQNLELIKPINRQQKVTADVSFLTPPPRADYRFISPNLTYSSLTNQNPNIRSYTPTPYYPILSPTDKMNGEFMRYFIKKSNENVYYEVNQSQVDRAVASTLYFPIPVNWVIRGKLEDVVRQNSIQIGAAEIELKIQGLGKFIGYRFGEFYIGWFIKNGFVYLAKCFG